MLSHSLRRFVGRAGWLLPLALLIILVAAQYGKQSGLAALGEKIPAAWLIVAGMIVMTPLGLLIWTGLTMLVVNNTRPNGQDLTWREVISLYLLASLTHVIFTCVSLAWLWRYDEKIPVQLPFLHGLWSMLITIDAVIATIVFFLLTAWYVRGLGSRTRLTLVENEGEDHVPIVDVRRSRRHVSADRRRS